jgi:hypothetical protein
LIFSILEKLGPDSVVFISSFHTNKFTSISTWKMPKLDQFIESLTHNQDNLINMWIIKGYNAHALVVHDINNTCKLEMKQKGKGKVHAKPNKEG